MKVSKHKSLRHLINHAIAVEDNGRGHKERMKGKKRMGDRDHHDRFSRSRGADKETC
jgi:hypothetical protein